MVFDFAKLSKILQLRHLTIKIAGILIKPVLSKRCSLKLDFSHPAK